MSLDEQIKQLISNNKIKDHSELNKLLFKKYACQINQSTLSRKLNKLGIKKIDGYYKEALPHMRNNKILDIKIAPPNILVIHTSAGHANSIASSIDYALKQENHPSKLNKYLLGTVAGDDTIIVVANILKWLGLVQIKNLLVKFLKQNF
jgi:arginine repressor